MSSSERLRPEPQEREPEPVPGVNDIPTPPDLPVIKRKDEGTPTEPIITIITDPDEAQRQWDDWQGQLYPSERRKLT